MAEAMAATAEAADAAEAAALELGRDGAAAGGRLKLELRLKLERRRLGG